MEPNFCFLQMRKQRPRDWPEFTELTGGSPGTPGSGFQIPVPPGYTLVISVLSSSSVQSPSCRMEMFSLSRMVVTTLTWPLSTWNTTVETKWLDFFFLLHLIFVVVVVQSLSHVQIFATPWTAACRASLSFTISWSFLRLVSIESVMPSNHLILWTPFSHCPQSFPASGSSPVS